MTEQTQAELRAENDNLISGLLVKERLLEYTEKSNEALQAENAELKQIAVNLHWMARRYADGRCTYAPGMVNDAVRRLQKMGVELNLGAERTPWARDGMGPGFSGLSKEEYDLGEPLDGWNGLVKTEEMESLCQRLNNHEEVLKAIESRLCSLIGALHSRLPGVASELTYICDQIRAGLKPLGNDSKKPYLGKPPRRQCDYNPE